MRFSLQEREKQQYERYKQAVSKINCLTDDELSSRYIYAKARYESKKSMASFYLVAILISILSGTWEYFFEFFTQIFTVAYANQGAAADIAQVALVLSVIITVFVAMAVFIGLAFLSKGLYSAHRDLLLIEEVKSLRKQTS